jgi:hypothetical protein
LLNSPVCLIFYDDYSLTEKIKPKFKTSKYIIELVLWTFEPATEKQAHRPLACMTHMNQKIGSATKTRNSIFCLYDFNVQSDKNSKAAVAAKSTLQR